VPVTAKLSKQFYDRLGEQVANELVDWFNQVDATYRSDLKEINELNYARFDAKVEQRFAQFETLFAQFEARVSAVIAAFRQEWRVTLADTRAEFARWLFLAWASLMIPILGLWFR
jgi:ABC-type transporter Mla subunit MlaD